MASFRLTPRAETDQDRIVGDGVPEWGKHRVEKYIDELEACFEHLALFPNMGTACDDLRHGYRKLRMKEHWVYYRIEDGGVLIVRIWPQRMEQSAAMLDETSPS